MYSCFSTMIRKILLIALIVNCLSDACSGTVLLTLKSNGDNEQTIYADGVLVGYEDEWDVTLTTQIYSTTGTSLIAVRINDTGNVGGFLGSFSDFEYTNSSWKCTRQYSDGWEQPGFDDSAWSQAEDSRGQGDPIWGVQPEVSMNAKWIWAGPYETFLPPVFVYCRKRVTLVSTETFSMCRTTTLPSGGKINYDKVVYNNGAFNLSTNRMIVNKAGFHFLSISVGIPAATEADVRLQGGPDEYNNDIVRNHILFSTGVDTMSRDGISSFRVGDALAVNSVQGAYSDSLCQTSFSGFAPQDVMNPVIVFYVGLSYTHQTTGVLPLDHVFVDTTNGWNAATNTYTIPIAGVYIFSFGTGAVASKSHVVNLRVSNYTAATISLGDTYHNDEDMLSSALMVNVLLGDTITLYMTSGSVYSDGRYFVALMGMLYSPVQSKICWSVHRVAVATGPISTLSFDSTLINDGNAWDPIRNRVVIPETGTYYVRLTAGLVSAKQCDLQLMVNGTPFINVLRKSTNHNGTDTRGRAIITGFVAGDILHVNLPTNSSVHSDATRITSFMGFRLHD